MSYKVQYSAEARQDLRDIFNYIAQEKLQLQLNMWKIILLLEICLDKEELNQKIYQHQKI